MTVQWALERLSDLRAEYAEADAQLAQLDRHRAQVREAILRLSGAIQVLEELIVASGAFESEQVVDPTPSG